METMKPYEWLAAELAERKAKNPRYSLRLFADKLGFSPGRLSEYLSGKREISLKQAEKIADRLSYSAEKRSEFFTSFALGSTATSAARGSSIGASGAAAGAGTLLSQHDFRKLSADAFSVVADWQHFAILSLMDLRDFSSDEDWIARRLGITTRDVIQALTRLERVRLIERKGGRWKKTSKSLTTTHDVPSAALKISHRQTLQQAADCLDEIPVELRDITSISMAIDVEKIPEAKKIIKNFRRKLCTLMESGNQTEIYNLNIQLVPVTKLKTKKVKSHDN